MHRSIFGTSSALALVLMAGACAASVVTFEQTPGGMTPADDGPLNAPYAIPGGGTVAFYFDVNNNLAFDPGTDQLPRFELAGDADPNSGFANGFLGLDDTANGTYGPQLGSWFVRQLQPGGVPPKFIVDYNTAQIFTALSGEIWDIDGGPGQTERWLVEVLDGSNNVIDSQSSPLANDQTLDGLPWVFSFSGLATAPDKVRITFTGSKTMGLGLAFNNFSPDTAAPTPEPGGLVLAAIGLIALAALTRGRKR